MNSVCYRILRVLEMRLAPIYMFLRLHRAAGRSRSQRINKYLIFREEWNIIRILKLRGPHKRQGGNRTLSKEVTMRASRHVLTLDQISWGIAAEKVEFARVCCLLDLGDEIHLFDVAI